MMSYKELNRWKIISKNETDQKFSGEKRLTSSLLISLICSNQVNEFHFLEYDRRKRKDSIKVTSTSYPVLYRNRFTKRFEKR